METQSLFAAPWVWAGPVTHYDRRNTVKWCRTTCKAWSTPLGTGTSSSWEMPKPLGRPWEETKAGLCWQKAQAASHVGKAVEGAPAQSSLQMMEAQQRQHPWSPVSPNGDREHMATLVSYEVAGGFPLQQQITKPMPAKPHSQLNSFFLTQDHDCVSSCQQNDVLRFLWSTQGLKACLLPWALLSRGSGPTSYYDQYAHLVRCFSASLTCSPTWHIRNQLGRSDSNTKGCFHKALYIVANQTEQ